MELTIKHYNIHIFRCIIALLFLTLTTYKSQAQVGKQRHDFAVGINGGYQLNRVSFVPKINQKFHTAPVFGATIRYTSEIYYGVICAFQAEVNYSMTGWKEDIFDRYGQPLPDQYQRNLHYIQVPVLAHLGFGHIDRGVKGFLNAGPQLSYLIKDQEKFSDTWTLKEDYTPDRLNSVTQQYGKPVEQKFEYGITAGLGMEVATKAGRFIIEGRYYMGLSNLFGNAKTDPFARSSNGTITAKVTYLFDILH